MHFQLAQVISLLIGSVLPLIVGYATKAAWHPGVRAVVLLALSAVSSFGSEFLSTLNSGTPFDAGATLLTVLGTFLVGVGAHFGLWRPTGASAAALRSGVGRRDVTLAA
jgi:hypothetical protein